MDSKKFPIKYFAPVRMKYVGLALVLFALISLIMKPSHAEFQTSSVDQSHSLSLEEKTDGQHYNNQQFASLGQTGAEKNQRPGAGLRADTSYKPMIRGDAEIEMEETVAHARANADLEPVKDWWPEPSYCRFDQLQPSSLDQKSADHPVLEKPDPIDEGALYAPSLNGLLMDAAIACLMDPAHLARIMDTIEIVEEQSSVPPPYFSLAPQAALVARAALGHQSEAKGAPEPFEKMPSDTTYFRLLLKGVSSSIDIEEFPHHTSALNTFGAVQEPTSGQTTYFSLLLEAASSQGESAQQTSALDTFGSFQEPTSGQTTYFSLLLEAASSQGESTRQTSALDTLGTVQEPTSGQTTYFSLLRNAAFFQRETPYQATAKGAHQMTKTPRSKPLFQPVLLNTLVAYGADGPIPPKKRKKREKTDNTLSELPFHDIILEAAVRYRIDPALIKAVIMAESGYDPKAVSPRGARGLMQLMPSTAKALGVKDVFDPFHNINGGVKYLRQLLDSFNGDVKLALAAYNAGSRYVRKYKGVPPFKATRLYIKKVIKYLDIYRKELMEVPDVA